MMVAISAMSEVKMGQLYSNGCHIGQPLKVLLSSVRQERPHKRYAVKREALDPPVHVGF